MTLEPLLSASPTIQIHAFSALAALLLGIVQFALPKGTPLHRRLGWVWVIVMVVVALSSFGIHTLRMLGPWSLLHLLSLYTLYALVRGLRAIRQGDVRTHRLNMIGVFFFGLIVAGGFTFLPNRIMHAVIGG